MDSYIDTLKDELAALEKEKTTAFADLKNKREVEAEYKRQYDEKYSEGDKKNYSYILTYWLGPATKNRQNAESIYNEINQVVEAKREQLTQAINNPQNQVEQKASFEQKVNQAKSETAKAIQGTTKYLIWGAVALVIVIGVIILLRKKLAS